MRRPAPNPPAAQQELELGPFPPADDGQEEREPLVNPWGAQPQQGGGGGAPAAAGAGGLLTFTLVASLGGLLFGYDTGCISGALPYIRDDLLAHLAAQPAALARTQELIVSSAIVAAGAGSIAGGWLADRLGRKRALLAADVLFAAGAAAMAAAQGSGALIAGRALVGLGVGLASVAVPIYIAEAAPPARRAALVTCNVLFITGGQFLAYVADFAFSFVPGTWRWMLGIAALPALAQMAGLALLPESPRWLAGRGRIAVAQRALQQLQPGLSGAAAAAALGAAPAGKGGSGDGDAEGDGGGGNSSGGGGGSSWRLLRSRVVLRELHVGVGLQVLQQVAGINTVMYFTPSILQLAGLSNQAALLLAMLPALTNALGTVVGMRTIDRCGRRRLLLSSLAAVALALAALGSAFLAAERNSPRVLPGSGGAAACPVPAADCTACLRAGCGFCGVGGGDALAPGTCLAVLGLQQDAQLQAVQQQTPAAEGGAAAAAAAAEATGGAAGGAGRAACVPPARLFLHGCPSTYTWLILACLVAYLAAFSPGLGPVPWAVNAEIYPLEVRGLATGIAATANWVANSAVAQTFLTLTRVLGGSGAFYLYCAIALCGLGWAWAFLPETMGLSLEEVQRLFGGAAPPAGGGGGRERKRRASDDASGGLEAAAALPPDPR